MTTHRAQKPGGSTRWISGVDTGALLFTGWSWPTPAGPSRAAAVARALAGEFKPILGLATAIVVVVLAAGLLPGQLALFLALAFALSLTVLVVVTVRRALSAGSRANVFGAAGSVESSSDKFGHAASIGAEGEKRTAALLDLIAATVPGVEVFHGLRFPGSARADVDHAVVYADRVWLIDSKLFSAGHYVLYSKSIVSSNGREYATHMRDAVAGFRQMLPGAVITSALVVHGRDVTVEDSEPSGEATIWRPEDLMSQLPQQLHLLAGKTGRHVDGKVHAALTEALIAP